MNRQRILIGIGVVLVAAAAAALGLREAIGGGKHVVVPANKLGCVYQGVESGGQFVRSIEPGGRVDIGTNDQLVLLPTGDQIYNLTTTPNRTALAPSRVLAFTRGQTAVWVEGVLKFRFNTDRACQWYSKYGIQTATYGNLGFTAHSTLAQKRPGWFRFLAEAHGNTMKQVVHDGSSDWTWEQLAYGFDPTVKAPPGDEPTSVEYGRRIGELFTRYLRLDLGADYFCGVQPGLTGAGAVAGCPPMYFQVLSVYPRDEELASKHDELKRLAAELARQRQAASLKAQNRAMAIRSAKAQRRVLEQQIINTRLDAQNDVKVQKCLILAKVGLDCDGHRQQIVVAGVPSGKK